MQYKVQKGLSEAFASMVKEAAVAYDTAVFDLQQFFNDKFLVSKCIYKGVPFHLFSEIQKSAPFTELEWAEMLGVSTKTLQRHAQEASFSFKPIHSEKILELAEVSLKAQSVFDSQEQFHKWLYSASLALGSMRPIDLLKNSYGKDLVMDELNRIDQGIFA